MGFDLATAKPVKQGGFDLSTAKPAQPKAPAKQPDQIKTRGFVDDVWRGVGMFGRSAMQGVADVSGLAVNPLAYATDKLGITNTGGIGTQGAMDYYADKLGFASPENRSERLVSDITRSGAGAMAMGGLGGLLKKGTGYVGEFGRNIIANPVAQAVATVGGATGANVAREDMGAGPYGQMIAGIVGGLAPIGALNANRAFINNTRGLYSSVADPELVGGRNLVRLYDADAQMAEQLRNATKNINGERLSVGQVLNTPESNMIERGLSTRPEFKIEQVKVQNSNDAARLKTIQDIAGSPEQMQSLKDARFKATGAFYKDKLDPVSVNKRYNTAAQILESTKGKRMPTSDFDSIEKARLIVGRVVRGGIDEAEAANLLKALPVTTQTAKNAITQAQVAVNKNMLPIANIYRELEKLAKSGNKTISGAANQHLATINKNIDSKGMIPASVLDDIKQNVSTAISDNSTGLAGASNKEVATFIPFKNMVTRTLDRNIPGYQENNQTYRAMTQPINDSRLARNVLKDADDSLNSAGAPAINKSNIDRNLKLSDRNQYGYSPTAKQAVDSVQASLRKQAQMNSIRSAGSDTKLNLNADGWIAQKLLGTKSGLAAPPIIGAMIGAKLGPLGIAAGTTVGTGLSATVGKINSRIATATAKGVYDSDEAARLITRALTENPKQAKLLLAQNPHWQTVLNQAKDANSRKDK